MKGKIDCILPKLGFIIFLALSGASVTAATDVNLQEVIDLVNFSREIIEDGELNVIFFQTPNVSKLVPQKEAAQRVKVEFEEWKLTYEEEKRNKKITAEEDKQNVQTAISYFEGYTEYLTEGKSDYEQQNIAFKVKSDTDPTEPHECMVYRLYRVDRYNQYRPDKPASRNRYLQQTMSLEINYHDLMVVNREYRVVLSASTERISTGTIEPAGASRIYIPFNLIGRAYFPIQTEKVVDSGWEKIETGEYYAIEYEPDTAVNAEEVASDIQRFTVKIWLDPQLDFCVIRDECYIYTADSKFKAQENIYTEFKTYAGGIWYPTRIEGFVYSLAKPNRLDYRLYYVVREADFNLGIPLDFFDLNVKEILSTGLKVAPYDH